jgi:hypothetical protein
LRKKLLLADLLLAALVVLAGTTVRDKWREARKREQVALGWRAKEVPPPPYSPSPAVPPLVAASYNDVAQQMLFSPDRNPAVIVEVAKPKEMPALPVLSGVLNLGDGPAAIMAAKAGESPREVRPGEKIGEFQLVSIGVDDLVLEWDGTEITRKFRDLIARVAAVESARAASVAPPSGAPQSRAESTTVSSDVTAPGRDTGGGIRACQLGDSSPNGTVRDGYRKVIVNLPMGQGCRWEPVR